MNEEKITEEYIPEVESKEEPDVLVLTTKDAPLNDGEFFIAKKQMVLEPGQVYSFKIEEESKEILLVEDVKEVEN